MKKFSFFHVVLAAFIAVVIGLGVQYGIAAFSSLTTGPMYNSGLAGYLQEVRGFKLVYAAAGPAVDGSTTTVTGMEAGDVIIDVVSFDASAETISNIDETGYTATSGGAILDTAISEPTEGDMLLFMFVDIDNTN